MVKTEGRTPRRRSHQFWALGQFAGPNVTLLSIRRLSLSRLLNILCLSFLTCKMGIELVPPFRVVVWI